jgi:hypothetical protein
MALPLLRIAVVIQGSGSDDAKLLTQRSWLVSKGNAVRHLFQTLQLLVRWEQERESVFSLLFCPRSKVSSRRTAFC